MNGLKNTGPYTCPYCLSKFERTEIKRESINTTKIRTGVKAGDRLLCPNDDCPSHKQTSNRGLPAKFLNYRSKIISLAGGVNTGKSHFIAALLYEITNNDHLHEKLDLSGFIVDDGYTSRLYEKYWDRVYNEGEVLDQTDRAGPDQDKPIICRVTSGSGRKQRVNFMSLWDTAGEEFNSAANLLSRRPNIHHSEGLILLIDPFQIPIINRQAQDVLGYDVGKVRMQAETVVTSISEVFDQQKKRSSPKILDMRLFPKENKVPIAICISKADLLVHVNPEFPVPVDTSLSISRIYDRTNNSVKWERIAYSSARIEQFLRRKAHPLMSVIDTDLKGHPIHYFAVSSYESEKFDTQSIKKKESRGVVLPLIWLLKQLKEYDL